MGLVLLHAAVLDPRLKHISVDHVLTSYRSLIDAPFPSERLKTSSPVSFFTMTSLTSFNHSAHA